MIKRLALIKWNISIGNSVIAAPSMAFLVAKAAKDVINTAGYDISIVWLLTGGIVICWMVGWSWEKFGFYSAESSYGFERIDYFKRHVTKANTTVDREGIEQCK